MRGVDDIECEKLLTREGRATLSLWRQLMIYLDPFALFADASVGPAWRRERAISFNRERRSILLAYVRRWALIAVVSLVGIACTEALAPLGLIPAAGFGISCSIAVLVAICAGTTYLLLGRAG